jgi:heme transporter
MPLVAELGVACAVAIAVDATVVRLVLVPALMAMFEQWNWWLPRWLNRILPGVDFEKPLADVDLGDLVVLPDDISGLVVPGAELRSVVKSGARLRSLAPDAAIVADPLAFSGCTRLSRAEGAPGRPSLHPVTLWRSRQTIALEALDAAATDPDPRWERHRPVELASVALPTGERVQIPTADETVRLAGYLLLHRNSRHDFTELAHLADVMQPETVAHALTDIDTYYACQPSESRWISTELVRRLADPCPDDGPRDEDVAQRCLTVAVAMLEEAR